MTSLTIGKRRGLGQLANARGVLTMLAADQRESFFKMLERASRPAAYADIVDDKLRIARILSPLASAMLLDPIYSAAQVIETGALPPHVGLLVSIEQSGYEGGAEGRVTTLVPGWSVAKIKRMGGTGVKLLVYYNPQAANAAQQEDLVQRVGDECARHDIPFLLEPVLYAVRPGQKKESPEFAAERPELVLETARRLGPLGVDILKVEFPTDPVHETDEAVMRRACEALTATSPVPWVLLSAGENFRTFQNRVAIACQAGASGFLVGRAIWQEALAMTEPAERAAFLATTGVARLRILCALADAYARPWDWRTPPAPAPTLAEGWHTEYSE